MKPRLTQIIALNGLLLAGSFCPHAFSADADAPPKDATMVYVGTYTGEGKGKGIYQFWLRTRGNEVAQNITLVPLGIAVETPNPSYLELDLKRRLIFAVNEQSEFEGKPTGGVSSFAIDPGTGRLKPINSVSSMGKGPCHLALDKTGKHLLIANYNDGTVAVIPVAADGKLGNATDVEQHSGKSVHPERQKGPHAHGVTLDPENKFAFVCDLGLDKVMIYRFDAGQGKLTPHDPAFVSTKAGAGPRHMVFRPDGRFAYVLNELSSTITAYSYDASAGKLTELDTLTTLPGYYDGPNTAAEIQMHPSGKWVYASNRGNETIVLFEIDKEKGTLTYIEEQNSGGRKPRHFGIQSTAAHMVILNQDSNTALASRIDAGNGRLKPSGVWADVPAPACAIFVPPLSGVQDKPSAAD